MENNDFKRDVNNIEKNVKQVNDNVQKESKKGKTKTIILMVIVLVLVLIVGILGGLLISGNGNKVTNIINQGAEKKEENKSNKLEYVTILEEINENNFKIMGLDKLTTDYDYDTYKITDYKIAKSIIDLVKDYKLDEKDIKSLPEMNHITISYGNTNIALHYNDNDNSFFISKGGETDNDEYKCWTSDSNDLRELKKIINDYIANNRQVSYFEQNKNLNYTSNPKDNINGKVAIIKMGEKTFQTTTHDGYYTYTDNFGNSYNIKEITNITSEYRMTSNDGATNLFRAVIEYIDNNNAKKSFDTAVFVPNDSNNYTTLSINGPYENYTGTTSFVRSFTDLYDDANEKLPNGTSKIIKQLSPSGWAGSSMQEVRLYDNGDVYHVVYNGDGNTEENVISFKLIARNADTIEEQMNGQAVETIIVKGKNLTKISDDGQLWIVFENN